MKNLFITLTVISFFISCNENQNLQEQNPRSSILEAQKKLQDSLAFELCAIYGLDQGIRNDSLNINKRAVMPKVDTLNFNRFVDFVKKHGYPNRNLLGEENFKHECVNSADLAVMLHNPHRLVNEKEYFDLFYEEVEKGNMPRSFFVDVLDKYYFVKSGWKHAMYGSQFGIPCLKTKEQTNQLRKEVGLEPLQDEDFKICE